MREVLTRQSPLKKVKRKRFASRFFGFILVLLLLFIGLGFVSRINRLVINEVEVNGTESLDASDIGRQILGSLSGKKLLFYSKANKFLFSKSELEAFIMETFPRVYRVSIVNRVKQKLLIEIEERHGAYTWCGRDAPTYVERFKRNDCYFLDQEGYVFDNALDFSEGVYLSIYGGMPEGDAVIGETINLENNIVDVVQMLRILEDNNLPVHSLVLGADRQHQFLLDTASKTGDYAKILWNEDVPLADTLQKLGSALSEENFRTEWEAKKEYLLYVDTRFNNRVFYKFQDEQIE